MPPLDDPTVRAAYEDPPELPRMSFGDHLDELRTRLMRSIVAIVVAIVVVMPFKDAVQAIIIEPYRVQWKIGFQDWVHALEQKEAAGKFAGETPEDPDGKAYLAFSRERKQVILNGTYEYMPQLSAKTGYALPYTLLATNVLEDMFAYMFMALIFSLVIASPIVVWQIWAFIAAGLYPKERRLFYRYFPFMVGLFGAGVAFGYTIALPYSLGFLIKLMNPTQVNAMISIGQFLNLMFAMTAAMGLMFQLPLVMVALQRVGLVTHGAFVKHWRITVLAIFLAAAVFTPPEPVSMMLMATPMVVLYALGLLLTWMGSRRDVKVVEEAP
ncbi:MAG: twin-arginine translocase subunit TatC [Planctomycetes bacterium]|jgi:sec-independent protein translocase protein TatC|nr:twin-arginine translocase subunit TatC [Planctomycetota bacterium]